MARRTFTLRDLLALIACCGVIFAIFATLIPRWREQQRRNDCLNNLRCLGQAASNYESKNKHYPLVSDAPASLATVAPGTSGTPSAAGYGWHVELMPYYCEVIAHMNWSNISQGFQHPPFSDANMAPAAAAGWHLATYEHSTVRCPTTAVEARVSDRVSSEYDALRLPGGRPMATSYVAIVGTHIDASGDVVENGVLVSRCFEDPTCRRNVGLSLRDISDGIANTLIACESREGTYAAWIDGQATWVVGLNRQGAGQVNPKVGYAGAAEHLIDAGGDRASSETPYSTLAFGDAQGWPGMSPRAWGPSSDHLGGAVGHIFADGHAMYYDSSIDATLYYFLITRNAHDPACCAGDFGD